MKKIFKDNLSYRLHRAKFKNKVGNESVIFGIYCAAALIQNILALKTIGTAMFSVTTGILISPVVFMLQDVESEVFGYRRARTMILCAYMMNFLFILLCQAAIAIPGASYYTGQDSFKTVFSTTPRIVLASFLAYCIGSIANAKIMVSARERRSLFFRAISSTVVGQLLDNTIFVLIAFLGNIPTEAMISMILIATAAETVYEIIFFPVTKKIIKIVAKNTVQKSKIRP